MQPAKGLLPFILLQEAAQRIIILIMPAVLIFLSIAVIL